MQTVQEAKNSASDRKRKYEEETAATQVRQSARGEDVAGSSLIVGISQIHGS